MNVHGLHHVTAVTGKIAQNKQFYTEVLGLRLVKKSVNQDDTSAYHLFYADKLGTPGTDLTFFDWPQTGPDRRGSDSVVTTQFRVNGRAALDYWQARLGEHGLAVSEIGSLAGREALRFDDPEGQRLALVDDGGAPFEGEVWEGAGIPAEHALRGFHGITLAVPDVARFEPIFTVLMNWKEVGRHESVDDPETTEFVYAIEGGGPGKEVNVVEQPDLEPAYLGAGGVHHVAFRLRDGDEQAEWIQRLARYGVPNSGVVDRFWFKSVYFRISRGILFELATDGPGFGVDESIDTLGERLVLPPFLESSREKIESRLVPV
jgi:glyoxalase family protein